MEVKSIYPIINFSDEDEIAVQYERLGADGVIICRPFVTAAYGGGTDGVQLYIERIGSELADMMAMCGANSLKEITKDMIWR